MATIIGTGLEGYLHRQARERALNRIAEAREEAQQIIAQATQEAERIHSAADQRAARTIDERLRRAMAQAHLQAKQMYLRRQEEVMQRLWSEAEAQLRALEGEEQRLAILRRLLADAAQQLGGGPLQIEADAQDQQLLSQRGVLPDIAQQLTALGVTDLSVADTPADIWGGVIVRRADTNELVDNSFNERLALIKRTLRDAVYHVLMPENARASIPEGELAPATVGEDKET